MLEQLIASLADRQPHDWARFVLNCELRDLEDGSPDASFILFTVVRGEDGSEADQSVLLAEEETRVIQDLRKRMSETSGGTWGTMDLEVDKDGTYRIDFDYGPPRRLNGIFDHQSIGRFNDYTKN